MGNVLWSILNVIILILIGWPVAFLCCGAYITISPFAACFGSGCDAITDVLQKGVQWPRGLGAAIANGDSSMGCWVISDSSLTHVTVYFLYVLAFLLSLIIHSILIDCTNSQRYHINIILSICHFNKKIKKFDSWDNDNTYIGWRTDDLSEIPSRIPIVETAKIILSQDNAQNIYQKWGAFGPKEG